MNGQKLLNFTLKLNALFSLISGLDFVVFDKPIVRFVTDDKLVSILPTGVMLIGFALFVFLVSRMKRVNRYLVGSIIVMDVSWVLGSFALVLSGHEILTGVGQVSASLVALVIAAFAFFQTKGLRQHLLTA